MVWATKAATNLGLVDFQVETDSALSLLRFADNVEGDRSVNELKNYVVRNGNKLWSYGQRG
ncbi:unnamed protein product [Cuscuta epithymum]|uniref:RNase H type-1 domain-containing protein n=1 Tax=Cuscuta epithymum TaxID=186058 RepID=A0AAV0E7Z6_9ASTE|nr:unnamed protein product [Cuscuta epithymum]